jgi:hypothetical protein
MKSTTARPPFRTSSQGYHRADVDTCIRALADERAQLQARVADLEAVLDATVQGLQARLAPRHKRSRRLAFVLVPLLAAMAVIPAVLYLSRPALNFATSAHSTIVNGPVSQPGEVSAPVVRSEQQPAAFSVATPEIRPEPPPATPLRPAVGSQRQDDGLTIVLSARNLCWIGATLDGKRRVERTMQRGGEAILHARDEVVLRVGNAGALSLTINGLAAAPLGRQGQAVTTRITLTSYKRLTGQSDP